MLPQKNFLDTGEEKSQYSPRHQSPVCGGVRICVPEGLCSGEESMTSEENMGKSPGFRVGPKPAAAGFLPILATAEIIPFFELIVSSNKRYEALSRSVLRECDGWIGAAPRSHGWENGSGGRGGRSRPAGGATLADRS